MLEQLLASVKSPRFSATVNVASGLATFLDAVSEQPEITQLLSHLSSPDAQREVFEGLMALVAENPEPDAENPHDAAIAAFLWVLAKSNLSLGELAAAKVNQCPQCWWAKKVASKLALASTAMSQPVNPVVTSGELQFGELPSVEWSPFRILDVTAISQALVPSWALTVIENRFFWSTGTDRKTIGSLPWSGR